MTETLYERDGLMITDRFIKISDGHGKCMIDMAEVAEVSLGPPEVKHIDTYAMISFQAVGFGAVLYDTGLVGICFLAIAVISLIVVLLKMAIKSGMDVVTITLSAGVRRPLTNIGAPIETINAIYEAISKAIELNQWDDEYEDNVEDDGDLPF